mmetsp:Transcript_82404/g.209458  ORF Transcript_82404/g.209458 Transcript_82404/m.209458 type:complete len:303 (-) Transcript_82404:79-987(-)
MGLAVRRVPPCSPPRLSRAPPRAARGEGPWGGRRLQRLVLRGMRLRVPHNEAFPRDRGGAVRGDVAGVEMDGEAALRVRGLLRLVVQLGRPLLRLGKRLSGHLHRAGLHRHHDEPHGDPALPQGHPAHLAHWEQVALLYHLRVVRCAVLVGYRARLAALDVGLGRSFQRRARHVAPGPGCIARERGGLRAALRRLCLVRRSGQRDHLPLLEDVPPRAHCGRRPPLPGRVGGGGRGGGSCGRGGVVPFAESGSLTCSGAPRLHQRRRCAGRRKMRIAQRRLCHVRLMPVGLVLGQPVHVIRVC